MTTKKQNHAKYMQKFYAEIETPEAKKASFGSPSYGQRSLI